MEHIVYRKQELWVGRMAFGDAEHRVSLKSGLTLLPDRLWGPIHTLLPLPGLCTALKLSASSTLLAIMRIIPRKGVLETQLGSLQKITWWHVYDGHWKTIFGSMEMPKVSNSCGDYGFQELKSDI